jgi:hypothetical protein
MRQIAKHGADRCPTVELQAAKVIEEAAELFTAILVHQQQHGDGTHDIDECPAIRSEAADTGLALYNLISKCGFDLIAAMDELVENDGRKFR